MILFLSCFEYNVKVKVILKQTSSYFSSFILCSSGNVPAVSSVDTAPNGCTKEASESNKTNACSYKHADVSHQQQGCCLFCPVSTGLSSHGRPSGNHFQRLVTKLARMATESAKAVCPKPESQGRVHISLPGFGALGQKLITKLY